VESSSCLKEKISVATLRFTGKSYMIMGIASAGMKAMMTMMDLRDV
jgi:hypothetical protein